MRDYTLTHLADAKLRRDTMALVSQDRKTTALLLAHIAEIDTRRAYAGAGHPSLFAYCVEELHYSEDAAYKRIQAARTARLFPVLFEAVADGRLHLTAICLLAAHLNSENVSELIQAATHRKKQEIEAWLSARFGCSPVRPRSLSSITPLASRPKSAIGDLELALEQVAGAESDGLGKEASQLAPEQIGGARAELALEQVAGRRPELALEQAACARSELAPAQVATPERYLVRVEIGRNTYDKLRYAQALLSHAVPSGDVAQVLERALDTLIARLERRKLGSPQPAGGRDRNTVRSSARPSRQRARYIPAHVRRAVWERDGGRCTFMSSGGHPCESRRFLEFDHVQPYARGGAATVEGLRLRCRAHNQYGAEQTFGREFMQHKRAQAAAMARRGNAAVEEAKDLEAGLRGLGCRADEARRAAEYAMGIDGISFEERFRAALSYRSRRTLGRSHSDSGQVRESRAVYGSRGRTRTRRGAHRLPRARWWTEQLPFNAGSAAKRPFGAAWAAHQEFAA